MTDINPQLTEREVLEQAKERLQQSLKFKADGYVCTGTQLIHVLLGIAATKHTLEAVCAELETVACAATIRSYLNEQLTIEELPKLERAMNAALAQEIPAHLCLREQELAIDYPRPSLITGRRNKRRVCGSEPKPGRARFVFIGSPRLTSSGVVCASRRAASLCVPQTITQRS